MYAHTFGSWVLHWIIRIKANVIDIPIIQNDGEIKIDHIWVTKDINTNN